MIDFKVPEFPKFTTIDEESISFDVDKIMGDIGSRIFSHKKYDHSLFLKYSQIALHETEDWFTGIGSLYDYENDQWKYFTKDYDSISKNLAGSYLETVIKTVKEYVLRKYNVKIGRIRIMNISPKSTYTLHVDLEEFRFHIPLITNPCALFIIGNELFNMPKVGQLYKFKTNDWHTAINAGTEDRMHILFDTYKE